MSCRRDLRPWTPQDEFILRQMYPTATNEEVAAVLGRSVASIKCQAAKLRLRKSAAFRARTQFKPGHVTWNKGTRYVAGGRSALTRFKRGEVRGRAAEVLKPVGFERISKDGYLERKVNNDMPFHRRWKGVHRIVWEETYGPIPHGYVVAFKPGRFTTDAAGITPDALELVSQVENMRRNSLWTQYPRELAELVQLRGTLQRQINNREKKTP